MADFSAYCEVCLSDQPVSQFRVLTCGHCFCQDCSLKLKVNHTNPRAQTRQWHPRCPKCRAVIRPTDDKQLFLDPPEGAGTAKKQAKKAVAMLDGLGTRSKTEEVEEVRAYMDKWVEHAKVESGEIPEGRADKLLCAIANFKDRIIPLYATLESQQHQITTLLRTKDKYDALKRSEAFYRAQVGAAEEARDQAIGLAEKARDETVELRGRVGVLHEEREKDAERIQNGKKLEEEVKRLKGHCEEYKNRASIKKAKMKGLQAENQNLKQQLAVLQNRNTRGDIDDSLRIGEYSQVIEELDDGENNIFSDDHDWSGHAPEPSHSQYNQPNINRDPLAYQPAAHIRQPDLDLAVDLDLDPIPAYKSTWNLPNKKRKVDTLVDSKLFPVKLDAKGRPRGTVHLGSRVRMGK